MRSVAPVYAQLRNTRRTIGPPQGQEPEGIYVMEANAPGELESTCGLDRCDFDQRARGLESTQAWEGQLSGKPTIRPMWKFRPESP